MGSMEKGDQEDPPFRLQGFLFITMPERDRPEHGKRARGMPEHGTKARDTRVHGMMAHGSWQHRTLSSLPL